MRERTVRLIRWLVSVTGALAKRIVGAIVAGVLLGLLILLLLTVFTFSVIEGDPVSLIRILVGLAIFLVGTLTSVLVGFIWPRPFIALLNAMPSGGGSGGGGGGDFDLFDLFDFGDD